MFEISLEALRSSLTGNDPVQFSYFKKDGTIRNAIGTLNEKYIPAESKPIDSSKGNGSNFKYYDLERKAWRSLGSDCSLVTIVE